MSVLVTGASGYIGRRLVACLVAHGVGCVPLSRSGEAGRFRDLGTGTEGPLGSFMPGVSAVVHLAGRLVDDRRATVADYFGPNVALTDEVAAAAAEHGVEVLVHASSRLVYPATLTVPADEDRDVGPDTAYGLSKRWAEDVVRYRTAGTGTSALSLRIAQVTGGDHPGLGVVNRFVDQATRTGVLSVLGDGLAVREIVHVDDVVDAIVAATRYRGQWHPVNIGGVEAATVSRLAREVASRAGLDSTAVRHENVAREDLSNYALDATRRRALLAWEPRIDLASIISEAFERTESSL